MSSKNIFKDNFPNLTDEEIKRLHIDIADKCSDYYFLDFLKTTNGNIDDAFQLFVFDEKLRTLLFKYVIRFEIQIKNDFVQMVTKKTKDNSFWNNSSYYIYKKQKDFDQLIDKINDAFKNLNVAPANASSYTAAYVMSFGTFVSFYKNINPMYKRDFIKKYTKYLPKHDFELLHKYLLCMRSLRNRCAHGTHIVSISFVNQLSQYSLLQKHENLNPEMQSFSIFELTIYFLIKSLHCGKEFERDLKNLLSKYKKVYSRYGGKQSINPTIINKIF